MAFTAISDAAIQVGKAITRSIMSLLKTNLDDLDSRMTVVEGVANKIVIWDETIHNAASFDALTGLATFRVQAAFNLTDAKIYIFTRGSLTGNLEIDIQKASSADFTSSVSVFTTLPKIVYSTASDYDESANTVFDGTNKILAAGDYLRLDITEMPAGGTLGSFGIYLIGEAS